MSTGPSPLPPLTRTPPPVAPAAARPGGRLRRLVRGREGSPVWERPALLGLLAAAALLYLVGLGAEGWANAYYSSAVQAGSESWKAFFYGSLDASNWITVDKPPLSLWLSGLSVRAFGLSSWSILVPQALAGVATVGLLYAVVRRRFGAAAGLIAGGVMALTPVAALMFRFNNPDAVLTLLMVAGAWAILRGVEDGRTRWVLAAGAFVGLAFLAKSLQAFLVLPAFALVWALAAPGRPLRRAWQVAAGAGAMIVAGGWWVAVVELVPASSRPYIGGSADNSVWDLIWSYNGLDRLSAASGPGGGPGGGFSGSSGALRLFNDVMGGQISWLIPFALVGLGAGLWLTRRAPRTDGARAGYVMWGAWLVTHALVFSFMTGIIHAYYTVAMAPAVGALVGMGAVALWRERGTLTGRAVLAAAVGASAVWAFVLLGRATDFVPWLRWAVLAGGLGAAVVLALPAHRLPRRAATAAAAVACAALLAGPLAYSVETARTVHSGGNPLAGPATAAASGGPGGMRMAGGTGATPAGGPGDAAGSVSAKLVSYLEANRGGARWLAAAVSANGAAGLQLASGEPVMAMGGFNGGDPSPTLAQFKALVKSGQIRYVVISGGMGMAGGMGAPPSGTSSGTGTAPSGMPPMGTPPAGAPSSAGGAPPALPGSGAPGGTAGGAPGARGTTSSIMSWVQANGTKVSTAQTGGATVYDLSALAAS